MSAGRKIRLAATGFALLIGAAAAAQNDPYGALGDLDAQLGTRQQRLLGEQQERSATQQSLGAIAPRLQGLRTRLQSNARALYRVSRGGMLPVAGGMAALLGHASRVSRLEQVVARDLETIKQLEKTEGELRRALTRLDAQIAASQRELSSIENARAGAARERASHKSFETALGGGIQEASGGGRLQYGLSIVGGAPTERFVEQRGNLALPISGPSSIQDATRAESDGPGLEFVCAGGAAVRAAASGRVAFAESYGSYGKLVILEHGDRYYTVYGGLARLEVQVGDTLSKSARLGSSGSDAIYFEVRRGTKTQDARLWLGL